MNNRGMLEIRRIEDERLSEQDAPRWLAERRASWRAIAGFAGVTGFILIYYWALLSDGRFLSVAPVRYGLVFNSMIEYLARGRFDVDPDIVLHEGFLRDGRTYAYFGIVPALLRWPLLVWPRFREVDFTVISCAIAATIGAVAKLGAVRVAGRIIGDAPYRRRALLFAAASVIFCGAQVQFARPSIFEESLYWAVAFAAGFVLLAFRWCVDPQGRRAWHLSAMAALAALCLLTRVSTAIGLYGACGGIMLVALIDTLRSRTAVLAAVRAMLLPSLILLAAVVLTGYINYQRWGSPLTFQDYRYYNSLEPGDPAFTVLANYGYFNFRRILFGLSYFFVPVWAIIGSDGHFLFRAFQDRVFYLIEPPPASFFASDMLLCFLAYLGIARLWRGRASGIDTPAARLVAISLMVPGVLMLVPIAITFRYRMEFYPFFDFLGLLGLLGLAAKFAARPRLLTWACAVMLAVSVMFSHFFLFTYKLIEWGDAAPIERMGWIGAWNEYVHGKYPALERYIGDVKIRP